MLVAWRDNELWALLSRTIVRFRRGSSLYFGTRLRGFHLVSRSATWDVAESLLPELVFRAYVKVEIYEDQMLYQNGPYV